MTMSQPKRVRDSKKRAVRQGKEQVWLVDWEKKVNTNHWFAEDKQVNDGNVADYIELQPSGELHLPRNRQLQALNRPFVMWEAWDAIKIVAR